MYLRNNTLLLRPLHSYLKAPKLLQCRHIETILWYCSCALVFIILVILISACFVFPPSQLRDCELAPGVNRDLARRVRNVNGITQHKQVLRNDIKLAAKLIHALDEKGDLWSNKFQEEGHSAEVHHSYNVNQPPSNKLAARVIHVWFLIFTVTCSEPHLEEHHRLPDRGGECWGGGAPRFREWDGSWGEC